MPFWYYANTENPVSGHLNTGISVLEKRAGSRYTGFRDPGIEIPNSNVSCILRT